MSDRDPTFSERATDRLILGRSRPRDGLAEKRALAVLERRMFGRKGSVLVDRYRILNPLGSGAGGVVYAAEDPQLGRRVAIKLLRRPDEPSDEGLVVLRREAEALARVSHPNVVPVFDVGITDARDVYIVTELVSGQTLTQWLADGRTLAQVVEAFIQAAAGLEAAHRSGLVHRDFKPSNVVVGDDGRVRVLDFGLARVTKATDSDLPSTLPGTDSTPNTRTRTRGAVGTPVYMPPEQHLAGEIGPRSDQFALCAALFEALAGELPFAGHDHAALLRAKLAGAVGGSGLRKIPRGLRPAILRGLSALPAARWPSLTALVDALRRGLGIGRRRRRALAGIGVLTITAAAWGLGDGSNCPRSESAAWQSSDDAPAAAVGAAFGETGVPGADETWDRVRSGLERYRRQWAEVYAGSCPARVSPAEVTAIRTCLARLDDRAAALVDQFAHPDPATVNTAVEAVDRLRPEHCRDANRHAYRYAFDPDEALASQVRGRIDTAWALASSGHHEAARQVAGQALGEARSTADLPAEVQARLLRGRTAAALGQLEAARGDLEAAYFMASEHGYEASAVQAAVSLTAVLARNPATRNDAHAWVPHASAGLGRAGRPTDESVAFLEALADLATADGDTHAAQQRYRDALALLEQRGRDRGTTYATILLNAAEAVRDRGDLDDAIVMARRALALRRDALGPEHPTIAGDLFTVGAITADMGDVAGARSVFEEALALHLRHASGLDLRTADLTHALGSMAYQLGELDDAISRLRRALDLYARSVGPDDPFLVDTLGNLGLALMDNGQYPEAAAAFERALEILDGSGAAQSARAAVVWVNRASLDRARGRPAEAVAAAERALTMYEALPDPAPDDRAYAYAVLARAELDRGRDAEARTAAEAAQVLVAGIQAPWVLKELGPLAVAEEGQPPSRH